MDEPEPGPSSKPTSSPSSDDDSKPSKVNTIREVSPSSSDASGVSLLENIDSKTTLSHFPPLKEPVFAGLTQRQLIILAVFGISEFVGAMSYSVQGPFFPKEASRKGVSPSQFGFAFGVFELAVLLFSPLFGKLMRKENIRPNVLYHTGVLTSGISTILFSLLGYVSDPTLFLTGAIITRAIGGIGEAAILTATFTVIADEFSESVTSTFASMKTFFGLGVMAGPVMGGTLFDALESDDRRFFITFGVLGGIVLFTAILGLFALPGLEVYSHELQGRKSVRGVQVLILLKIGSVRLAAFSTLCAALSIGFLSAILEPHLRSFNVHPVLLGGIFVINGGLWALSAPVWKWIGEKFLNPKIYILIGASLIIDGFILIGPADFIPLDTTILVTCIGLVLHGIGLGALLTSSFNLSMKKALEFGYKPDVVTYGTVASLWVAMFSIGGFIGPSVGGILFDNFGFRSSSWLVIGIHILLILTAVFSIMTNSKSNDPIRQGHQYFEHEEKPLLHTGSKLNISDATLNISDKSYGAA